MDFVPPNSQFSSRNSAKGATVAMSPHIITTYWTLIERHVVEIGTVRIYFPSCHQ